MADIGLSGRHWVEWQTWVMGQTWVAMRYCTVCIHSWLTATEAMGRPAGGGSSLGTPKTDDS